MEIVGFEPLEDRIAVQDVMYGTVAEGLELPTELAVYLKIPTVPAPTPTPAAGPAGVPAVTPTETPSAGSVETPSVTPTETPSAGAAVVAFSAEDLHSGVAEKKYMAGSHAAADFAVGGEPMPADAAGAGNEPEESDEAVPGGETVSGDEVRLSGNGIYAFYVRDFAGNETVQQFVLTGMDFGKPVITAEGPADIWNKEEFTVMLPDVNLLPFESDNAVDGRYFTVEEVTDGSGVITLDVTIGAQIQDGLYYDGNGSIMLHAAAADASGNRTKQSFGPYRLDNQVPEILLGDPDNDYILVNLMEPERAGQADFGGYTMRDNLTTAFSYYAPGETPAAEAGEGSYTILYDAEKVDNFTKAGRYPQQPPCFPRAEAQKAQGIYNSFHLKLLNKRKPYP